MPPKKPDPEAKEKEFEAYKESEEYKKIEEVYDQIAVRLNPFISQTSREYDLNGRYQILWDLLYELAVLMKIKPPFKKLEHEWMRSAFFGEKKKVDKNDVIYTLDGVVCQFDPVDADSQHYIRQALVKKITNMIRQKQNFDIENYAKTRVQIKKGLSEMFSLVKSYTKKSYKIIFEEKFMELIKPFSDLLEINMKYVLQQLKYTHQDEKFINNFKKNAIIERYCECLEISLDVLMTHQSKPLRQKIKPANVFKKLQYDNLTKVEAFYLNPFHEAFDTMKKGLCALFASGINFWKVPLEQNKRFVEDLQNLVNWEIVTERHFGNELVRDQINFMADSLFSVDKANDQSRKYMILKDPNCIEIAIPRLIAFKTIQYMRNYKDKEQDIRRKEEERNKIMGNNLQENNEQNEQMKSLSGSPNNTKHNESIEKPKATVKNVQLLMKDQLEEARNSLGRYWVWQNYCDDEFRDKVIEEGVEMMRHINKAVQQDIEDTIVREAMLPRKDRHDEERISAAENLKNMKTYHNADKAENMRRPPELWNFPKVIEQEHKFRSISEPKKCYIDGRIEKMDEIVAKIGDYFKNYNKRDWNELVRRVIDFFDGKPNPDPAFEDI